MYQVTVKDVAERSQIIEAKCRTAPRTERFFACAGGPQDLPVIDIELSLPIYRLANYRTQTQQMSYARSRQLGPDFFRLGQENASAQQAQHAILVEYSKLGSGDTIIPIFNVLRGGHQQTDALLITRDGVVVNGNRRLSAMRELYAEDPTTYASFASIQAKVLPAGLTAVEIKRIETRLQMTPQTLLPYDWVNEALAIRDLKQLRLQDTEIAAEMKLSDPSEIQEALEQLREAEIYLSDHLHAPQQYEKIIPHKQQFIELNKALSKHRDPVDKELARKICYVLTANSDDLGRRVYDYRIAYGVDLPRVVEELEERLGLNEGGEEASAPAGGDLLDDGTQGVEQYTPLIERLSDPQQSSAIAAEIAEICNHIREDKDAKSLAQSAFRKAQKAHTLLVEISLETAAPSTLPNIAAQLNSITARAAELLHAIEHRNTGS